MQELYSQCREYIIETGRFPRKDEKYTVLDKVYDKIEERDIWIPYTEVYQHFLSKETKLKNRLIKEGILVDHNGKLKLFRKVILPITTSLNGIIIDVDDIDLQKEKEKYTEIADTFLTKESLPNQVEDAKEDEAKKDLVDIIRKENGKHIIVIGKSKFIKGFIEEDIIDEYIITIKPLILSEDEANSIKLNKKMNLKLLSVKKEGTDAVLRYKRIR